MVKNTPKTSDVICECSLTVFKQKKNVGRKCYILPSCLLGSTGILDSKKLHVKGVFSKSSGDYIVVTNFCLWS